MTDYEATFSDAPNDYARTVLLSDLTETYRKTKDRQVGGFLAQIVCRESLSDEIRLIAYLALCEVADRPVAEMPSLRGFKIPDDLDQSFLKQFLRPGRGPQ